jgi:hypothetical protein
MIPDELDLDLQTLAIEQYFDFMDGIFARLLSQA